MTDDHPDARGADRHRLSERVSLRVPDGAVYAPVGWSGEAVRDGIDGELLALWDVGG